MGKRGWIEAVQASEGAEVMTEKKSKKSMVSIDRETLSIICESAEARLEQWESAATGGEPYEKDCIYECDNDECSNIAKDLRAAIERANALVAETYKR